MEGLGGDGPSGGSLVVRWWYYARRVCQYYLYKTKPYTLYRWIGTLILVAVFCLRIYYATQYCLLVFVLGLCILPLISQFLTPQDDPQLVLSDGLMLPIQLPTLQPIQASDEFKPFIRLLPEFRFWYLLTGQLCCALLISCDPGFDLPGNWFVLLCCWLVIALMVMRHHIAHMMEKKYIPFSIGKQKYGSKKRSPGSGGSGGDCG